MSGLDRLAQYHVEGRTILPPEHKATPVVVAEPAPRQEQAGTDTSEESRERQNPATPHGPASGSKPEASPQDSAHQGPAGTAAPHHPDDDWPEMPAFLVRTEQGRG